MAKRRECKDCLEEGITTGRPAPHPGPRCSTHHRARKRATSEGAWEKRILETYGITAEEYYKIHEAQGGRCYICQRANGSVRRLAVDHDHDTGLVRGLLCKPCNRNVLGHARDDIEYFERAIAYLQTPPAQQVVGERVAPVHGTDAEKTKPRKRRTRRKK